MQCIISLFAALVMYMISTQLELNKIYDIVRILVLKLMTNKLGMLLYSSSIYIYIYMVVLVVLGIERCSGVMVVL